jgi:DNA modification methylase
MPTRKDVIAISLGQRMITDFMVDRIPPLNNVAHQVKELPTSFKQGALFAFARIKSTSFTHGLHAYPAKFVPQIPRWAIRYARVGRGNIVLDPFCGCGTTLVEARLSGICSYGIDIDPLARLVTSAKSTPLYPRKPQMIYEAFEKLIRRIQNDRSEVSLLDQCDVNLHYNWKFWFNEDAMKTLVRIKRCIRSFEPPDISSDAEAKAIRDFFLVCFSSIIKRVSYLDEDQIKVKRDPAKLEKGIKNPIRAFEEATRRNLPGMVRFTQRCRQNPATVAKVIGEDARSIPLDAQSVDLIVTSPPYLNAIDYPFAHKHELFILDLVEPENYRPHSRKYIGVSERVLLKSMYSDLHLSGYEPVDGYITKIYSGGKDVDKNRAFVVFQYFTGMQVFLEECNRVLRKEGSLVIFVGDNRIRNIYVPTHTLLLEMAKDRCGFEVETFFYHRMKHKKLAIPRYATGGEIETEMAVVLRRR